MHVLTSTDFRKQYASLRAPTRVTVNGHVIGTWMPSLVPPDFDDDLVRSLGLDPTAVRAEFDETPLTTRKRSEASRQLAGSIVRSMDPTYRPEFRPVPKPGRK